MYRKLREKATSSVEKKERQGRTFKRDIYTNVYEEQTEVYEISLKQSDTDICEFK